MSFAHFPLLMFCESSLSISEKRNVCRASRRGAPDPIHIGFGNESNLSGRLRKARDVLKESVENVPMADQRALQIEDVPARITP